MNNFGDFRQLFTHETMRQRQQHKLHGERSEKSRIKEKVLFERGAHEKRYFINFFHSPLAAKIPIKHNASCATIHMLLFFPECFCISRVCAHRGEIRREHLSLSLHFHLPFAEGQNEAISFFFFRRLCHGEGRLLNFIVF